MTSAVDGDVVLRTHDLGVAFGGFHAVKDVNLQVRRGARHAVIGPNGAGKTTMFNLLSKFILPTRGSIHYEGRDITALPPSAVANHGIVRSFQISAVFQNLSLLENVRLALQKRRTRESHRFWASERRLRHLDDEARRLLSDVGLYAYASHHAGSLPYGRKRALELATTLALEPSLMLLDEPMAGMGREDIDGIAKLIARFSEGRTVLMVEHNLSVVAELCDRVTVMQLGQVLAEGPYAEVAADPRVRAAYIGSGTMAKAAA